MIKNPRRDPAPRPYRTLGNGAFAGVVAPSEATLLLVLAPDVDQAQTRRLLRASGARIVDGPSDVGAYVVAVDAKRASASRDALRAFPTVARGMPRASSRSPLIRCASR